MTLHRCLRSLACSLVVLACGGIAIAGERGPSSTPSVSDVTAHYPALAFAMYEDSLRGALVLTRDIDAFLAAPSEATQAQARRSWIDARRVYSQTEVFRFGNPNVDQWEGNVNAWPIDEGFIDYVNGPYSHDVGNPHARENLIASSLPLDVKALRQRHEMSGIEPNVATGYHAIEFLLWGRDPNTPAASAGSRPATDFATGDACTNGSCDRRRLYLKLATNILVADLRDMVEDWRPEMGAYWHLYGALSTQEKLQRIVLGLAGLSGGELAGERLRVALLAHSQEDEQSCFSDTTHLDVYYNVLGIHDVLLGRYVSSTGVVTQGPSLYALARRQQPAVATRLFEQVTQTLAGALEVAGAANAGTPFDQQITPENSTGRARIETLITRLEAQTATFEALGTGLASR